MNTAPTESPRGDIKPFIFGAEWGPFTGVDIRIPIDTVDSAPPKPAPRKDYTDYTSIDIKEVISPTDPHTSELQERLEAVTEGHDLKIVVTKDQQNYVFERVQKELREMGLVVPSKRQMRPFLPVGAPRLGRDSEAMVAFVLEVIAMAMGQELE